MPILLLHETNLTAVKAALRSYLPELRSGHLTEALAAGLGFRTHAALRADLIRFADFAPMLANVDEIAFAARLAAFGYAEPPADVLGSAVRSDAIPDRPIARFRDGDRVATDAHYAQCSRHGRPMMMIKRARTYATLEWDCITINARPHSILYGSPDGPSTVNEMVRLFKLRTAGAPGKPNYRTNVFVGWVYKLLPATAELLAEDYFRLLYQPVWQAEHRRAA